MNEKVRVMASAGSGAVLGMMDPVVGMVTDAGTIAAVTADGLVTMGDTDAHVHGGRSRFYAHQLRILVAVATDNGWPSGADCVVFGHAASHAIIAAQTEHPRDYVVLQGGVPTHHTHPI